MSRGTIQQALTRIKGRIRLFRYDLTQDLKKRAHEADMYLDRAQTQKVLEMLSMVLIGVSGFSLGQLSAQTEHEPVLHDTSARIRDVVRMVPQEGAPVSHGKIVASKKGKKWHYSWCPGASTISEKNKRWFQTEQEAQKAGYTQANNCK